MNLAVACLAMVALLVAVIRCISFGGVSVGRAVWVRSFRFEGVGMLTTNLKVELDSKFVSVIDNALLQASRSVGGHASEVYHRYWLLFRSLTEGKEYAKDKIR